MSKAKKALARGSTKGRTWWVVLVTLLVLAACAGSAQARFSRSDDSSLPSNTYAIKSGGLVRTYRLYVPASYSGKPVPLLVALHPALSDGAGMEKLTRFDNLADRYGVIVAYPDGVARMWNADRCCGRPMKENIDDVGFINDMVAKIESNYAIDTTRKYVAGFSNGAFLAHHIACVEPDAFTAYAVTGGAITDANCPDTQPTPILLIHGTRAVSVLQGFLLILIFIKIYSFFRNLCYYPNQFFICIIPTHNCHIIYFQSIKSFFF